MMADILKSQEEAGDEEAEEDNLSPDTKKEVAEAEDKKELTLDVKKADEGEGEKGEEEKEDKDKEDDDKDKEDGDEVLKVSDVFLNLENKQPSYLKENTEEAKSDEKTEEKAEEKADKIDKDEDDEDDFERDEDVEADVDDEEQNKVTKMKVNINVTNINAKKSIAENKEKNEAKKSES